MKDPQSSHFAILMGKAVRDAREREGLSRLTLALDANINSRTLERIEDGETIPSSKTLYKISRVIPFDTTATYNLIHEKLKHLDCE